MDTTGDQLSRYVNINKKSNEFAKIEYMLQLSLGTSTAVIKNIYNITKPHLNTEFEKNVNKKNLQVVYSFVDTADLQQGMSIDSIVRDGFTIPTEGAMFATGLFRISKSGASAYRVLLSKVAVGKSLCYPVQDNSEALMKQKMIKENYDSVYLKHSDDEINSVYRYEYVVFDKSLVHPEFLIDFTFDDSRESNLKEPICDDPGCTNIATHYCINDKANLCTSCNEKYHESIGSLLKDHIRVPIKDRPRPLGKCEQHKNQDYQFFCKKCKTAICIYCKINGSHSTGEYGNHVLITIDEAFKEAVNQSKDEDRMMTQHKAYLKNMLKQVDEKISIISENAKNAENQLYNRLEAALETLQAHTQTKLNILLADQLELRRRFEEIQWAESFLKYQFEVLEPQDYLKSWFRHLERKGEIIASPKLELAEVAADLRVVGEISVVTSTIMRNAESHTKNNKKK